MDDLIVQSYMGPYSVQFGHSFVGLTGGLPAQHHLIIDAKVAGLYKQELAHVLASPSVLKIEASEENKSLERFPIYVQHLLEMNIRKDHTLVAVGGGIIQDIVSFLAAIVLRGVSWIFYPTTLLAQADSCIGSKSSINIGQYKNQLGTFTPPKNIFVSTGVLDTLEERDIRSGLGEIIKVHIISGWEDTRVLARDYSDLLRDRDTLSRYIRRSLEIKKTKIEIDEFDQDERLVMNFGHSFGHALESATDFSVPHGVAVTLGMDLAVFLSLQFGFISSSVYGELHKLFLLNMQGQELPPIQEDRFWDALSKDKKNLKDKLTLILMKGPGQVFRAYYKKDESLRRLCVEYLGSPDLLIS